MRLVEDRSVLDQLESRLPRRPVTDPAVLEQLNASAEQPQEAVSLPETPLRSGHPAPPPAPSIQPLVDFGSDVLNALKPDVPLISRMVATAALPFHDVVETPKGLMVAEPSKEGGGALTRIGRGAQLAAINPALGLAARTEKAIPSESAIKSVITKAGGEFKGIKADSSGKPALALFNEPKTGTTLALAPEEVTTAAVKAKMASGTKAFKPVKNPRIIKKLESKPSVAEEEQLLPPKLLSKEEEIAMAEARVGGAERGSIQLQPLESKPGTIVNEPLLNRIRDEAAVAYKRTFSDKALDILPPLRDPRRYLSQTASGEQLANKTIELERTLGRANEIIGRKLESLFAPIRGKGRLASAFKQFIDPTVKPKLERLGKILEAKEVPLNPTEAKIAHQGRRVLDSFADALDLAPEQRLSDYYPHIFRGQYQIKVKGADGIEHTIPGGFSSTQRGAYVKAEEYLSSLTPEMRGNTTLIIADSFNPDVVPSVLGNITTKRFRDLQAAILEEKPIEEQIQLAGKLAYAGSKPKVFFRHMLKRTANLEGYEPDAYEAFKQFSRGAIRKIYFDRYLPEAERLIDQLPSSQQPYARRYVEWMKGTPSMTDQVADKALRNLGFDLAPNGVSRVVNNVNQFFYISKLGLGNLSGAAVNSLTLLTNAPAKIGPRATLEGIYLYIKSFASPKLRAVIRNEGPTISRIGDVEPTAKGLTMHMFEKTATPFQFIEDMTHDAVFLGARNKFLRANLKPGVSLAEKAKIIKKADEYGRFMDLESQIPQTRATRPEAFRNPLIRGGFQFKSFLPKMVESIAHMTPKEKTGFATLAFLIGGPNIIPMIRYLADRNPKFAEAVDWANDNFNLPRIMGFDFSGDVGVGFVPEDMRSLPGPGGSLAIEGVEAVFKLANGESISNEKSKIKSILSPAFPTRFVRSVEGLSGGAIKDSRGRPITRITPSDASQYALFGSRSRTQADISTANRRFRVLENEGYNERQDILDKYVKAKLSGNDETLDELKGRIKKYNALYPEIVGAPEITNESIRRHEQSFSETKAERLKRQSRKRGEAYQKFINQR